ncbi:glutamine ABC transporter, ATP-binding domain protein [Mycobacterium ulcerans str. Harvey]|uniref:Glutamine ABC transporter, ATP-binding domain protein n=1 Tax=Mycobacterium ulcerans str. Harvey TaxID=1299332 RepID=A0ABP3ASN2_MYCUL|nr:glutamine ABC transporter, ATP-binding domain protein [Mycobacterium ulcerans str. Harvey]
MLGFSYSGAMRLVVVPQGVRRVLPALVNQFIALLKASALVYFLGLIAQQRELFQVGRDLNAQTGNCRRWCRGHLLPDVDRSLRIW